MKWLAGWIQEVRRNSRLRYGLWLLLFILVADLLLDQQERLQLAIGDKRRVEEQFRRTNFSAQVDWQARLAEAEAITGRMEPYLWRGESPGVVQANLQKEVTGVLNTAQVSNYRIRVSSLREVRGAPGLWRMDFSVGGRFRQVNTTRLLSMLEAMEKKVVVQNLTISAARMNLLASAYVVGLEDV